MSENTENTEQVEIRFDGPSHAVPKQAGRELFAAELRKHPGEWALLGRVGTMGSGGTLAWQIRGARETMTAFAPAGAYEAEAKTLLGEHRVYVRYVGGVEEQAA